MISRHRLGLKNTEPDILGRAYEYLLRKFAEGQGQSAGEFYTPKEVGWLIAELIDPAPTAPSTTRLVVRHEALFDNTRTVKRKEAEHNQ